MVGAAIILILVAFVLVFAYYVTPYIIGLVVVGWGCRFAYTAYFESRARKERKAREQTMELYRRVTGNRQVPTAPFDLATELRHHFPRYVPEARGRQAFHGAASATLRQHVRDQRERRYPPA